MPVGRGLTNDNQNWSLSFEWMKQDSAGVNQGSERLPGTADERTVFEQTSLILRGPLSEQWTLGVRVPHVQIEQRVRSTNSRLDLDGLGDVSVWGEYGDQSFRWVFGLKLPTGDEAESPAPGLTPPSLLQLGTGTLDPMLGFLWNGGDGVGFEPYFDALAILPFQDSDAGLQPGQSLTLRAGGLWNLEHWLTPGIMLEVMRRDQDRLNGAYLDNTGATIWTLVPSVQFPLGGGASARASWRMPLDQDVNGMQLVPDGGFVLEAGWVF